MHELAIAHALVEQVLDQAEQAGAQVVYSVKIRIGALADVLEDPLRLGFEVATQGTVAAGARLDIVHVPVSIECEACGEMVELPQTMPLACPTCGTSNIAIRCGRELDLESLEVDQ